MAVWNYFMLLCVYCPAFYFSINFLFENKILLWTVPQKSHNATCPISYMWKWWDAKTETQFKIRCSFISPTAGTFPVLQQQSKSKESDKEHKNRLNTVKRCIFKASTDSANSLGRLIQSRGEKKDQKSEKDLTPASVFCDQDTANMLWGADLRGLVVL